MVDQEVKDRIAAGVGGPSEIFASRGTSNKERLLLEQDADVIWLDPEQASTLVTVLLRFLERV